MSLLNQQKKKKMTELNKMTHYQHCHLLIIDDEAAVCDGLAFQLRYQYGFKNIQTSIVPHEALETIRNHNNAIDVVLLDLRMPEIDGITLLEEIKSINSDIVVIILSALAGLEQIKNTLIDTNLVLKYLDGAIAKHAILEKSNIDDLHKLPIIIGQAFQYKQTLSET